MKTSVGLCLSVIYMKRILQMLAPNPVCRKPLGFGFVFNGVSMPRCVRIFFVLAIACLFTAPDLKGETPVSFGKNAYARAYDIASPSVVSIRGEKKFEVSEMQKSPMKGKISEKGKQENVTGMGTGVIVDPRGYIVTNYHVVKGLQKIQITTYDETLYREVVFISYDTKTDLALLKIKPTEPLTPIRFGKISRVWVCQDVLAIGNPFGYSNAAARGIVSGLNRPLTSGETASYDSVIQTDAAINPGNSGGPLINLDGEMIGMNAAVRDDAQNIAFAIPVDMVADVVERMIRISVAKMTHHGLTFEEQIRPTEEYPLGQCSTDYVQIKSVEPNSPAEQSGARAGDILRRCNGLEIHSTLDFTRSLIDVTLSDKIELSVDRDGESRTFEVALSQLKADESSVALNRPITPVAESGEPIPADTADFSEAQPAPQYAQNIAEKDSFRASKEETVHDYLGVEIVPISAEEYKKRYPNLSVVSMDQFKIMPSGGVEITTVSDSTVFSTGKSGVRQGDLLFGFVVGDSADNRWEITSLDNLYFIARKWNDLAQNQSRAKLYLIRNGAPYFLDIPMNPLPVE